MNEVTKLYENAGLEPVLFFDCESYNQKVEKGYLFTAEKQLSLIKWIAEYKEECRITYEKEYKWCTQTDWQSSFCYDNFPASLANLINNLWQDLTEEECKQIKNILESEVRE